MPSIYRITESGHTQTYGELWPLANGGCRVKTTAGTSFEFEGMPPFVVDLTPHGYLAKGFTDPKPARVSDGPGNIVIGEHALERWRHTRQQMANPAEDYPELAQQSPSQIAWLGGERPKFLAFSADAGSHVVVKHAEDMRWRDLLACEHIALEVLNKAGVPAARSRLLDIEGRRFLEIERFDRVGKYGRIGVISMAAFSYEYIGSGSDWSATAQAMHNESYIGAPMLQRIQWLDVFGQLIANTDRHLGNLSFFQEDPIDPHSLRGLTPVYDMLPMALAGPQPYKLRLGRLNKQDHWADAVQVAIQYWRAVARSNLISEALRGFASQAAIEAQNILENDQGS